MAAIHFRLEVLASIVFNNNHSIITHSLSLHAVINAMFIMCIKAINTCSFMLCSFGISTEASAPAVLSL